MYIATYVYVYIAMVNHRIVVAIYHIAVVFHHIVVVSPSAHAAPVAAITRTSGFSWDAAS